MRAKWFKYSCTLQLQEIWGAATAHRQHLKCWALPSGVIWLGKKILFPFGTCTSSITSCILLQILAGGWWGWLQLEYIIKQKAIKIHGSQTVCWSYKNGALCLIFLIKRKKKYSSIHFCCLHLCLKQVWVFTILWQGNTALHFKHIKASSVTATKSLSSVLGASPGMAPYVLERITEAIRLNLNSTSPPEQCLHFRAPNKQPGKTPCQRRQRGEQNLKVYLEFHADKSFSKFEMLSLALGVERESLEYFLNVFHCL